MKKKYVIIQVFLITVLCSRLYAQAPDFSLVGFATENGGTTGGLGGIEITVSNYDDLKKYAEVKETKYIIKFSGTITGKGSVSEKNYLGSINVASNKSIIGFGNNAFLDGVGFTIKDSKNIIIQNVIFSLINIGKKIPAGADDIPKIYSKAGDEGRPQILVNGGDLISISGNSSNIWIDHCEFFEEDPFIQKNQDLYDGLLDVKDASGFITVSWCYFHDHHKCSLVGSSDTNLSEDRKITFHHNFYKTIQERVPLYRGGTGHFFNNYNKNVYGGSINSRAEACLRVEKNIFEDCKNTVYSKNSKIAGCAERIDNREINCKPTVYPSECSAVINYDYSKVLTRNVDDVKMVVTAYSGVGKLK